MPRLTVAGFYNGSLYADGSTFAPIPELHHARGDISLYFLSPNFVQFTGETDDPWYSAHFPFVNATATQFKDGKLQMYLADNPTSILGCLSQYQICNHNLPADHGCTTWDSLMDTFNSHKDESRLDQTQNQVLGWIGQAFASSIVNIVDKMGISGLTSRYGLNQGIQGPLAPDQWQLDVEHWFTVWLATLQGMLVLQATGPSDADVMPWVQTPRNEAEKHFCQSQVSRSVVTATTPCLTMCFPRK